MWIRFTRRHDGRHRVTIERDDGTVYLGEVFPAFGPEGVPHDLLQAVVEQHVALTGGLYPLVKPGFDLGDGLDLEAWEPAVDHGALASEAITRVLEADVACAGLDARHLQAALRRECDAFGIPPIELADAQVQDLRALRDLHARLWRGLPVGETLELELPGREDAAR